MDPFLGEVRLFGGNFAPRGWAFCNGQLLTIADNSALFSLFGTTYGGDGQTTFALPNLQGRLPLHQNSNFPLGQMAGSETVTLISGQIGAHIHTANAGAGAASPSPANAVPANTTQPRYLPPGSGPKQALSPQTVQPSGTSQPHENMMPYLAVSFIVALEGIYPSQN